METRYCGNVRVTMKLRKRDGKYVCRVYLRDELLGMVDVTPEPGHAIPADYVAERAVAYAEERGPLFWGSDDISDEVDWDDDSYVITSQPYAWKRRA